MATALEILASAGPVQALPEPSIPQGQLLDLLPVAAYICDKDGKIVRYNRRAADLWGRAPKPRDPRQLFCGSLRMFRLDGGPLRHSECPMAQVLRTGAPVRDQEVVIERPDASRAVALVSIDPLLDERGDLAGALNCFQDVTEQRRAQAVLTETEKRGRELLQTLPAAVYTIDREGRITFYNEAAAALWGVHPEIGTSEWCGSWRLCWPDGRPMPHDECPMAIALKEGVAIRGAEAIAVRPDGMQVPFLAYPTPLRDESGTVVGAINMLVDVTERKQAEHASSLLAAIVESSEDAIGSKNLQGTITSWNRAAERLFGYTAEEAIGQPVTMLIPADRQDEEPGILQRIRRGEKVDSYETIRRRKDGSLVDISLTVSPLKDARGEVVGASKIARDITDRKRAEEQRDLILKEMGHRVKNLFALASSVVGQTARWTRTPAEMAAAVKERLGALARAQELTLAGAPASGDPSRRTTGLAALAHAMLSPYAGEGRSGARAVVDGPTVLIAGDSVTSFALLLHEFATNAAKYGALSAPEGRVKVSWDVEGDMLRLTWQEVGGPVIEQEPEGEGFGSVLASNTIAGQFGGDFHREWHRDGLVIRLTVPLERLTA